MLIGIDKRSRSVRPQHPELHFRRVDLEFDVDGPHPGIDSARAEPCPRTSITCAGEELGSP
ncbi:hypothetical protein ACFPM0_13205 [Pseudonocardia sulfidoxydans]|uniref:hypothetical protein n=1 Tax=Pseudonocardia sulfidoxydans TaxID=54011 RepID=UPI00360B5D86